MKPRQSTADAERNLTRAELPWLIAAILCGSMLRLASLDELALEHYDEAVYASNLVFLPDEGEQYPGRPMFAPPLWPGILEWFTIAWRMFTTWSPRWLPMIPGILCGISLIPSAWWVMRRWFGAVAAISAAWMIALSEYHAFYSRTALTDVPLIVVWLWAVYAIHRALEYGGSRPSLIAGGVTAIAWWTKYNGWLPLAIGLSGGVTSVLMSPPAERNWKRVLQSLGFLVTAAMLLWLPVLWDCRTVGGYSAVAANHRAYMVTWSQWWPTLLHQAENFATYTGLTSGLGVLLALIAGAMLHLTSSALPQDSDPGFSFPFCVTMLAVLSVVAVGFGFLIGWPLGLLLAGSLGGIVSGLDLWRRGRLSRRQVIAACLLSAWLLGLLLATPHYRAFPRLLMPLWLAGCLCTAWFIAQLISYSVGRRLSAQSSPLNGWTAGLSAVVVAATVLGFGSRVDENRTATAEICDDIARLLATEHAQSPAVVFVYGDPALFVRLRELGIAALLRGDLGFADSPPPAAVYHVASAFAHRDGNYTREWDRFGDRFTIAKSWPIKPSSLVLLDHFTPRQLRENPRLREQSVTLYRLPSR